ncbi:MAG: VOC family protein [Xanthomonadaceae bacterium]|nr:VOC family protein [Xanthomonadaceae bacterium]
MLIINVEIPVADLERAIGFYERVFGETLERVAADGYAMALFPVDAGAPGASCALVVGDVYVPAKAGPLIYVAVADLEATLARAEAAGARILYPPKAVGAWGRVAEFEDCEGNRIGLHQAP